MSEHVPTFKVRFAAMASDCEVHLAARDEADAVARAQCAIDEVRRIETTFSRYRADSIISRINAGAGGDWIEVDPETEALLAYADTLYASSSGLFDITSGVLRRAWDFKRARLPEPQALAQLLPLVGWPLVERSSGRVRLPRAGMELDFGGFGKEYAADRAAALLGQQGGYVNLGGDLRVMGPQPDGRPWQIGIAHPRRPGQTIATIPIAAGALATSGDYERFFDLDGKRYCHILDPRSGTPVAHWGSVSVLAPLAIAAGSVSTIAMLKQGQAREFLDASGLPYLAVMPDGSIHHRDIAA